jgi:hypothetical protein
MEQIDPEIRVADLESELRQRDDKIKELRDELDERNRLVDEMREYIEDHRQALENWIEVFDMHQDDAGVWRYDPRQMDLAKSYVDLCDVHNKLVGKWNKFVGIYNQKIDPQPPGRPLAASEAQIDDVLKRRKAGESLRGIAAATGLGVKTVRSVLSGSERTAKLRRAEFNRQRAAAFRARHNRAKQLEKDVTDLGKRSAALIKAAKGLGQD